MSRLALGLLIALVLVAPADAALRSPHLESSCADGFNYGEITLGEWVVEGCHKTGTPDGDETDRTIFKGDVELNGMLVEGASNLLATTGSHHPNGATQRFWRIERTGSAKLVLDPKIAGARRRFVIYTGAVDLELLGPAFSQSTETHFRSATSYGLVDIPVGSDATVLGMRLGGTIHDAKVSAAIDGGSIQLKPRMTMGATASALLRDWVAKVDVETVDGKGMKITNLVFAIPDIEIEGIGGFEDLHVTYSESRDEWSGGVKIDLGDLFPGIDFDMSISASTGAPTAIQIAVSPLNIALGPTGIFLQGLRGGFNTNPLILNSGVTLTAGPEVLHTSVLEINGDTSIQLEPFFRMENTGNARFLPIGSTQIARGDGHLTLDSRGYLSTGGSADFEVSFLGVGARADIGGSGAYSSTSDVFNVEAHATGTLLLGFLGEADILKYQAVISSNGWGTCGNVFLFVKAGVGQQWDGNPQLLLSCDLGPFDAHVPDPGGRAAAPRTRRFMVARGTKEVALEISADGPEPRTALLGPDGKVVAATVPAQRFRAVGADTVVIAPPGSATQVIVMRNPKPGRYTLGWEDISPQVTGIRLARDIAPLSAKVSVARVKGHAGQRRVKVTGVKGLGAGESLVVGVKTPAGVVPIRGGAFPEFGTGTHEIVGAVLRNGVPMPGRTRVLGHYTATLPARPAKLLVRRTKSGISVLAKPLHGAELPDAWQYVIRTRRQALAVRRGRPGVVEKFPTYGEIPNLVISARPVVGGVVLRGAARRRTVN